MFSLFKSKNTTPVYAGLHTDMHSHLIPGVDDGAPDMETSLGLIRGLAGMGFKKLITTPHIMWEMYPNTHDDIRSRILELWQRVEEEGIGVEIQAAAEYFLDGHFKSLLDTKESLLTISGNMVLVEFSMASPPLDLKEMLFDLQLQGYQPVIAHPERYVYHERNKEFFVELKAAGYLFQLNINSLAGFYGKSSQNLAQYMIKNDFYDLAGTDLHSFRHLEALGHPAIAGPLGKLIEQGRLLNKSL
ncbi:MAG: hypothetical protein J0M30_04785 [Chitinophagales bacterium]|nr:hypothetical protein [Chitinophagales bacterium]